MPRTHNQEHHTMSVIDTTSEFTVNIDGQRTGTNYRGLFKVKKYLSHADFLLKERIYLDMLGPYAEKAGVAASNTAEMMSTCHVRILEAPIWWKEAGNGMSLVDEEPPLEIYQKIKKIDEDLLAAVRKKGQEARD